MWHVGMGSTNEPYLICLKYNGDPENKDKVFALVGKGVCFDSGGLSLKSSMMDLMHMDKVNLFFLSQMYQYTLYIYFYSDRGMHRIFCIIGSCCIKTKG